MRTLDTGQTKVYEAPGRSTHLKVSVKLSSTWYNLSDLDGFDFLESVDIDDNVDNPSMTARVVAKRRHGLLSIWPEDENSKYNNLTGSYAPLLQSQREIKIETAVMPSGVDPIAADWQNIFEGKIGPIEGGRNNLTIQCTDLGGDLMRNFIETQRVYGSSSGVAVQTEMQQILTDNSTGVTLYTPTSPGWNVKEWIQQKEPVLTALRRLAQQIGWQLKYRYDEGTSAWRLTFYEPDRSKTTPDYTFSVDDTFVWGKTPSINDDSVRNKIRVIYTDALGENPAEKEVSDATSIALYGTRFFELQEDSSSNIDTLSEATDLADAILADLKDPILNVTAEVGYFWAAETGDLYRFPADDVNWTSDKDLAVQGFVHHFPAKGMPTTTLTLQGKVTGYVNTWLQKQAAPGIGRSYDKLGPIEKWKFTRHSVRSGAGSFHINHNSTRRKSVLPNWDFGHQSRVIAGSGWEPDSWTVTTGSWGSGLDWYVDTISQTNDRSLVYTSQAGAAAEITSDFIPVEAGIFYANTFLVRTDLVSGSTPAAYLDWYDSSKSSISSTQVLSHTFNAANTWERPYINLGGASSILAPSTARYARVRINCVASSGQKIWIDQYYLDSLPDSAVAKNGSSQSIPGTGTWTVVNLTTSSDDPYSHADFTNDVIHAALPGSYVVTANAKITGLSAGDEMRLRISGATTATGTFQTLTEVNGVAGPNGEVSRNATTLLSPRDPFRYFRLDLWQDSGSGWTLTSSNHEIQMVQVEQLF